MKSFPIARRWVAVVLVPITLTAYAYAHRPDSAIPNPPPQTYAAIARGRVDVPGGLLQLAAPREGTIAQVHVQEGDVVRHGQVLAALDDTAARLAQDAARAQVDRATAQIAQWDSQLTAARQHARRLAQAAHEDAGDAQAADDAATAVSVLVSRRAAAQAGLALARTELARARHEQAVLTLRAPTDADVLRVAARPGATASPQSPPLFVLLPHTAHIVRAELNVAVVDAVSRGMASTVTADDGSDQSAWPATVLRIGQAVGPSWLEEDPQLRASTRTVECVLALDDKSPLRVGQRVMVRFGSPLDRAAGD
jgi:multidrug resistance efflux pump